MTGEHLAKNGPGEAAGPQPAVAVAQRLLESALEG